MVLDTTDGGLRTLARDLAPLQRFTPSGPAFPYPPAWSPDGRVIALSIRRPFPSAPGSTDLSDAGPAILLVDVSTGSSRLAEIHLRSAEAPAWSPDGRRLAFIGSCTVVVSDCLHVFVADPDGSRLTDLMPTVRYVADRSLPVWTGDGTSIVATVRDPVHFVVSIPVDGSGPTTLESGSDESGAAVSPDGESIAFQRRSIGPDGEASIAYEWGKHTRSGYRSGILWATWGGWRPVWSPDGAALLGLACPPLFGATGTCELTVGQVEVGPGSGTPPGWPIGEPRDLTYGWQPVAP
jgi:Tol biopolymer transport system component